MHWWWTHQNTDEPPGGTAGNPNQQEPTIEAQVTAVMESMLSTCQGTEAPDSQVPGSSSCLRTGAADGGDDGGRDKGVAKVGVLPESLVAARESGVRGEPAVIENGELLSPEMDVMGVKGADSPAVIGKQQQQQQQQQQKQGGKAVHEKRQRVDMVATPGDALKPAACIDPQSIITAVLDLAPDSDPKTASSVSAIDDSAPEHPRECDSPTSCNTQSAHSSMVTDCQNATRKRSALNPPSDKFTEIESKHDSIVSDVECSTSAASAGTGTGASVSVAVQHGAVVQPVMDTVISDIKQIDTSTLPVPPEFAAILGALLGHPGRENPTVVDQNPKPVTALEWAAEGARHAWYVVVMLLERVGPEGGGDGSGAAIELDWAQVEAYEGGYQVRHFRKQDWINSY